MKKAEVQLPDGLYNQIETLAKRLHLTVADLLRHPTWVLVDYPGPMSHVMDDVWRLAAQPSVGRRIVFDGRLALTLRHHGVTEFATRNTAHFTRFGFTRVWDPLTV